MTNRKTWNRKPANGVPDIGPFREQASADRPGPDVRRAFRLFGLPEPDYDRAADVAAWLRTAGTSTDRYYLADNVDAWNRRNEAVPS